MVKKAIFVISIIALILLGSSIIIPGVSAAQQLRDWEAHPPIHLKGTATAIPAGLSPAQIRHAYGFDQLSCYGTNSCGAGQTIAIVDAYDDPNIQSDLNTFDTQFGLPACDSSNGCFTKATPQGLPRGNTGWALEESLDVEWAHAIAPGAKIILVEAKNAYISSLLGAVDYAVSQPGVHQVSMSWGGGDSASDSIYDSHFNVAGISFTASAGDSGTQVEYPAASPYIVGVGGTTLNVDSSGNVLSETAWSGSGGGVSSYESKPIYQNGFNSNTGRGVPDVSYEADPNTGVSVYDSYGYGGWLVVGGTSVGAPQWAAAISIANSQRATPFSASSLDANSNLYNAAGGTSYNLNNIYFRDITSGTNGGCGAICTAGPGYDFITGLGSPLSNNLISLLQGPPPPPPSPDFSLSATSVTIQQGSSGASTVTITPSGGFNSGVSLSLSGNPSGVTGSFSPNPATTSSTLTLTVGSSVPTGSYTLTVTGTSGSLAHTNTLTLTVSAPPPPPGSGLTVNVSTDKSSYTPGSFASITVTVTSGSTNISGASVTLTITAPNGATSQSSGTTNSNGQVVFSVHIGKHAQPGTYTASAAATDPGYTSGTGSTTFQVT